MNQFGQQNITAGVNKGLSDALAPIMLGVAALLFGGIGWLVGGPKGAVISIGLAAGATVVSNLRSQP